MVRKVTRLLVAAVLAAAAAAPALAEERGRDRDHRDGDRDHREFRGGDRDWHDRDIHRFAERDFDHWRGGRWFHGRHDGRLGWWWVVGSGWYFYPQPAYPYPDPYTPPYAASGATAWYYCPPLQTYYPYAPTCPAPWQVVPAQ
jgi:hypothetical protein